MKNNIEMQYGRNQDNTLNIYRKYQKKKEAEKMERELLQKIEESIFQIGDVKVRRGEKYQGDISFANGDIVLPGTIIWENFLEKRC